MAETYPCPVKAGDITEKCLGAKWLADEIYTRIAIVATRVRAFQTLMGKPLIPEFVPATTWKAVDCIFCDTGNANFDGIGDYVRRLFMTGYVVKQVKLTGTETVWAMPPANKEDVTILQACDAFWTSWDQIYTCMDMDKADRDKIFSGCGGGSDAMTYKMWNDMFHLLDCMAYYKCYPSCMCVYCQPSGEGCQACNRCLTVQINFETYWALEWLAGTTSLSSCVIDFTLDDIAFRDSDGIDVPGISASITVHLVKSYVIWKLKITDVRSGAVTATMQYEYHSVVSEGPSKICEEIQNHGELLPGGDAALYVYDSEAGTTTKWGDAVLVLAMGYPICDRPWEGIKKYYQIDMTTVPECIFCSLVELPVSDGKMVKTGGGLALVDPAVSHLGRSFGASVEFDDILCAYRMKITCTVNGAPVPIWEGLQLGNCGGPEGVYNLDPEFINPCFGTSVTLNNL